MDEGEESITASLKKFTDKQQQNFRQNNNASTSIAMAAAVEDITTFADDNDDNNNCSVNNNDDDYNNINKNLEYARRLLYISHFTSQFAEWAWQFSLVIWLAALSDYSSLFLVSIYQATAQLLVLSLVPALSKMIDSTTTTTTSTSSSTTITSTTTTTTTSSNKKQQWNRSQFATYLIAAQNVCVFIATMTIGFTMKRHCQLVPPNISDDDNDTADTDAISFSRMALIAIICCFGGMAQVLDKTVVVAIERDWIVVMADESINKKKKTKTTNKQQQQQDEHREDEEDDESSTSTSSSTWLQDTNVTLKQMDLSCQVLGPSISGLVLANYGGNGNGGFGWVGGCTVVSLITEVLCMKQIYQLVPSLQQQQQQEHQSITNNNNSQEDSLMAPEKTETITAGNNNNLSLQQEQRQQQQQRQNVSQESSLMALDDDPTHEDRTENNNIQSFSFNNNNNNTVCWDIRKHHQLHVYASQTMAWAGFGLALLYFNVLTFSGMMTAYLVSCGMSKFTIGIWRGISSIVGLLGTFVFSQSQSRLHLDLETTAFWSLIWEFVWLTLSLSSIWVVNNDNNNNDNDSSSSSSSSNQNNATLAATLLIAGVLPSRIGLWVYDISVTQLFQQTVAPNVRGQVGGTQMSLNAFFEFLPFVLGMIYSDVNDFWILIVGGYLSVGLAIVLYTFGVYLPYKNTFQAIPKDDEDFPAADGGTLGDVQLTER
eukprot:scaffold14889_cov72-Cylindrotheca_fusiformis.AAC.1